MSDRLPIHGQLRLPLQASPRGGITFVRSGGNLEAAELLDRWPGPTERVLALCGPEGVGKSMLAALWAERVGAVGLHGVEAAHADPLELAGRPVLLDDADQADDETLFHLINLATGDGGALLMTARAAPRQWRIALPDLRSRLDAIRVAPLAAPDDTVLAAILRARLSERSITPSDEVVDYLVRRMDRSPGAMADLIERLDAPGRPVTRALARQALEHDGASGDLFDDEQA